MRDVRGGRFFETDSFASFGSFALIAWGCETTVPPAPQRGGEAHADLQERPLQEGPEEVRPPQLHRWSAM